MLSACKQILPARRLGGHFMLVLFLLGAGTGRAQFPSSTGTLLFPGETDALLLQWGQETVNAFLAAHGLPAADASVISQYGRQDLRDNLRAFAWLRIQEMIANQSRPLTGDEQQVLNRFAADATNFRVAALRAAVNEKNRFLADRCGWKPDQSLSKASGYTYDGAYYCPKSAMQNASSGFGTDPPASPPKEYFTAYGQKVTWIDPVAGRPGGIRSFSHITLGGALLLGIGLSLSAALAIVVTVLLTLSAVRYVILPFIATASAPVAYVGAGLAVLIGLALIVITVFLYTENNRIEAEYPQLDSALNSAQALMPFNRSSLGTTLSDQNTYKLLYATFANEFVPTFNTVSTAAMPARTPGVDPVFVVRTPGFTGAPVAEILVFPGWEGEKYYLQMWRGWFLSTTGAPKPNIDSPSINTRIRYLWGGVKYEAARAGGYFLVRKAQPGGSDVECPVNSATRVSSAADLTKCKDFVTTELPIDLDEVGTRMVSVNQAPQFTSLSETGVSLGSPRQFTITASGVPAPAIFIDGSLPAGFTYTPGAFGSTTLSWSGAGSPTGTYQIPFRAMNAGGSATQLLTVTVYNAVKIVEPAARNITLTYAAGSRVSFEVRAVGTPVPYLQLNAYGGRCGLSASDGSNGSITMQGIIAFADVPAGGTKCVLDFIATNENYFKNPGCGCGTDAVSFTINVTPPSQQPALVTRFVTAPVSQTTTATIVTTGGSGVVNISLTRNAQDIPLAPGWVSLQDNGDGTATLSATPPPIQVPFTEVLVPLWYRVAGTSGNQAASATDGVVVRVIGTPIFEPGSYWYFVPGSYLWAFSTRGEPGQWAPVSAANGQGMSVADPLPAGLTASQTGPGRLQITGVPLSAGDFRSGFVAINAAGVSTAPMRIVTVEPATITSAPKVNFYVGQPNTFTVTAIGFPMTPLPGVPPGWADPMRIWTGFPDNPTTPVPSLAFRNTDPLTGETLYGRALITGTPLASDRGTYDFILFAETGNLSSQNPAKVYRQQFQAVVTIRGDVNGDARVDCADVTFITSRYNQRAGMARYDYNADYNHDGVIDVRDAAAVLPFLPRGTRCN